MNIKALTRQYWPTAALFVALIAVWQLAVSTTGIREYLLPAPLSVWNAMWFGDDRLGASICGRRPGRSSAPS